MFNNNNKKARSPATPSAKPLLEIHKKEISDSLKIVEKLIKIGNLDGARAKLETVRSIDPKNGFILALEERIDELRKAKDVLQSSEPPKTNDESSPKSKVDRGVETEYLERLKEEVHKFEERLVAEYRDRFTEEIGKAEQRIAEMLKEELETHDAEREALLENLNLEKENLFKDLRKEARKLFEVEFKRADDSYRKLLEKGLRKIEEKAHVEISAGYDNAIDELSKAIAEKKSSLLEEERNALIEETRKETENEFKTSFMVEFEKKKAALTATREERKEVEGMQLRTDQEEESDTDRKQSGRQKESRLSELDTKSEERYRSPIREIREAVEKRSQEVGQDNPKSGQGPQREPPEVEKEPAKKLGIKSDEQLARERELMEKLREMEFSDILNGVNWMDRPHKRNG